MDDRKSVDVSFERSSGVVFQGYHIHSGVYIIFITCHHFIRGMAR
jgi:hypothetical protein